jgi:hypothetical protein
MSFTDGAHRVRAGWLVAVVVLAVTGSVRFAEADTPATDATVTVPLAPVRILDTRTGLGAPASALGSGQSLDLQVTGAAGVPVGAVGVLLNVTADGATEQTYLTIWPAGEQRPDASSLNPAPGQPVPNFIEAKLGVDGKLSIYNFTGSVHVLADVAGYQVPTSSVTGLPGGAGPRGLSAWDTIPAGVTVTGTDYWKFPGVDAPLRVFGASVDLPAATPVPLTDATLGQKASSAAWDGDEDPQCTGSFASPTAPPGTLCVYLKDAIGVTNVRTIPSGALRAFLFTWDAETANQHSTLQIAWAYTAPL